MHASQQRRPKSTELSRDPQLKVSYWLALAQHEQQQWDRVILTCDPEMIRSARDFFERERAMIEKFSATYVRLCVYDEKYRRLARKRRITSMLNAVSLPFCALTRAFARG